MRGSYAPPRSRSRRVALEQLSVHSPAPCTAPPSNYGNSPESGRTCAVCHGLPLHAACTGSYTHVHNITEPSITHARARTRTRAHAHTRTHTHTHTHVRARTYRLHDFHVLHCCRKTPSEPGTRLRRCHRSNHFQYLDGINIILLKERTSASEINKQMYEM